MASLCVSFSLTALAASSGNGQTLDGCVRGGYSVLHLPALLPVSLPHSAPPARLRDPTAALPHRDEHMSALCFICVDVLCLLLLHMTCCPHLVGGFPPLPAGLPHLFFLSYQTIFSLSLCSSCLFIAIPCLYHAFHMEHVAMHFFIFSFPMPHNIFLPACRTW